MIGSYAKYFVMADLSQGPNNRPEPVVRDAASKISILMPLMSGLSPPEM